MKPDLVMIALWITALRSGLYQQGKHRLCTIEEPNDQHKYCCLGVAELLALGPKAFNQKDRRDSGFVSTITADKFGFFGPIEMNYALGEDRESLTYHNDIAELNFKEIAYLLETEFLRDMRHS